MGKGFKKEGESRKRQEFVLKQKILSHRKLKRWSKSSKFQILKKREERAFDKAVDKYDKKRRRVMDERETSEKTRLRELEDLTHQAAVEGLIRRKKRQNELTFMLCE
jgi:hypothetical protein